MACRRAKAGYGQGLMAPPQSLGDCSAQNGQAAYVGVTLFDDGTGLFFAAGRYAGPAGKARPGLNTWGSSRLAAIVAAVSLPIPGIAVSKATPLALLMKLSDLLAEFQDLRLDRPCNFEGAIGDSVAPAMADGRPARPLANKPVPQLGSPPAVPLNTDSRLGEACRNGRGRAQSEPGCARKGEDGPIVVGDRRFEGQARHRRSCEWRSVQRKPGCCRS